MRQYSVGDRVVQQTYGTGTIAAINEYHTVVDFDEHGARTFATPRAQFEPSSTVAPPKRKKTATRKPKVPKS